MLTYPVISQDFVSFFFFFEVITSPLYSIVIYGCTERQMIPQSFTQRLYIFFLILSMTFESKLQLVILDAKPQVIDATIVYGFNPVKLTVIKLCLKKPFFKLTQQTSLQELEVLVIHHIMVTIGNQDTTTFSDWIARVEWRHQSSFQVDLHFPGRCGIRHYHPDVEPFCSLGGTVGARGGFCSVKFWLTFVNVTRLKTSAGWMRPGK